MTILTGDAPKKQTRTRRKPVTATGKKKRKPILSKEFKRNLGLYSIGIAVLASMDAFSAGVISLTNPITYTLFGVEIHLSIFETIFCFGAGLLAFIGGTSIAKWKADPRKQQQGRVLGARIAILVILIVGPIPYFGKGLTHVGRYAAWTEYSGSKQEELDAKIIANPVDYGEETVAAAQERYKASVKPRHATLGVWEFIAAMALYTAVVLSGEIFFVVAPETEGQRKERRAAERKAERDEEQRTAEERAAAERKRQQSLTHRAKAVILDFFSGKRQDAA